MEKIWNIQFGEVVTNKANQNTNVNIRFDMNVPQDDGTIKVQNHGGMIVLTPTNPRTFLKKVWEVANDNGSLNVDLTPGTDKYTLFVNPSYGIDKEVAKTNLEKAKVLIMHLLD